MRKTVALLASLTLSGLLLASCSAKEAVKEKEETKIETAVKKLEEAAEKFEEKSPTEDKTFAIGDKITFEGESSLTITGVNYTDERNQFADVEPLHVLVVTYNVDNLSDDDYVVGSELELYVNGKKMETYPIANTFDTVSPGRSFEGASQAFAITEEGEFELEVEPSISFNTKPAIVKFTVQ